jgi:hypothetical protein
MLEVAERRFEKPTNLDEWICKINKKISKPPFSATEMIECPLPMVKPRNPVSVDGWCHGWALKNELCHYAGTCAPYLDLVQSRIKEGKPVNLKILKGLGIRIEYAL